MPIELSPVDAATLHAPVGLQDPDDLAIDVLMRELYEVISFMEGGEPDWARMQRLFSRHARITRVTPEQIDYFDLDSFQNMARDMLELGVYTSFYERELRRSVRRFGATAHVLSAYETKQSALAREPFARGVNSIQLVREDGVWRVLSLFWDEEQPDNPLRLHELFTKGDAT